MPSTPTPAAVPGPANDSTTPAGSPSTAPGGLTGILTPVEPARPAFTLTADTGQEASHEQAAEGTSSAAYQDPGQPENTKNPSGNTSRKDQKSVIRAWLLAAAKRWEKGADARNKRLDLKKAKLQARQVRETVTVNRSEGSTGSGKNSFSSAGRSGSGKSLEKVSKTPSGGGVKNTSSGGRKGSAGGSGSSGAGASRSPSSGNTAGAGGGARSTSGTVSPSSPAGRTPKTDRSNGKTHTPTSSGSTGSGGGGPRSTGGEQATKSCSMGGTSSGSRKRADGRTETTTTCGHGSGISLTKEPRPKGRTTPGRASDRTDHTKSPSSAGTAGNEKGAPATGPAMPPAAKDPKQKDSKNSEAVKNGQGNAGTSLDKKPTSKKEEKTAGKDAPSKTAPAPTPLINTQPSREAGYRDGTRAAKVVAHVEAWRDGYRDGYADTKEAAAREKARLDQAHADRKNARTPKDQPVPQPASSADYQQPIPPKPTYAPGPQPIQVTSIDATDIHLGEGAARPTISRGEVRRLRDFQQRLHAKTDTMTRIGEATRILEQHAQQQAKQVTQLLEQARSINGGDKLIAALTKLAEAATTQAEKAAELHTRAHRATEACTALVANTGTRYDGIYQAVVDSPETSPAELRYYREMEAASA